jgi:glycine dehydrogenase subunit 1
MSYVPHTREDRARMLKAIGAASVEDLFAPIPPEARLAKPLHLPEPLAEQDLLNAMEALAARNETGAACFLGAGCYDHFIPPAVDALANRSEFYTAYTPYQPEISQGMLQAFFEYQTMICEITGMDASNASLYDGATAVAEAVLLCVGVKKGRKKIVLSEGVHPDTRRVVKTYVSKAGIETVEVPLDGGRTDPARLGQAAAGAAAVAVQSPNVLGFIEEQNAAAEAAHKAGALCVSSVDPISLGILDPPGALGVDVAVGEGQGLGCPMSFGGPGFGFLASREEFLRHLPGRLVGATVDGKGRRGFVLTFQTREQHIRREKATSNICSNQGLMALRAAITLALLGPRGLAEVAALCTRKAHLAAETLGAVPGFSLMHRAPFFKEFPLSCPVPPEKVVEGLLPEGVLAGIPFSRIGLKPAEGLLVAVTEKRTAVEIQAFAAALKRRFAPKGTGAGTGTAKGKKK